MHAVGSVTATGTTRTESGRLVDERNDELGHPMSPAVAVARLYLDALVVHGRLDAAQALMTSDYRLARAQSWLANRAVPLVACGALDGLARGLASGDRSTAHYREFEASEIRLYQEVFAEWWARSGTVGRPRPLGADLELVLFVDMAELDERLPPGAAGSRAGAAYDVTNHAEVLLRTIDGRPQVAGHSARPVTAGWPPQPV